MAQQTIGIGASANDGTGDPIRDAFDKCNDNFSELYTGLVGLLDFKGTTDCSANPNYPAASKGDFYVVSVAGKIGGASGTVVEVGDAYFAKADNAGGTQASVGTSWAVVQGNIVGGTIAELDDIPDVNAPSPADGDVLAFDTGSGTWVPVAQVGGGLGGTVPDGGADGQVLTKQSAVDQDVDWESLPTRYHAISIQPSPAVTVAVNSTTFLALQPFNFFLDRDVFPATHFRIVIRGSANEAAQTISCQMAIATAPTVPLHTSGGDLSVTNTSGTHDSGWRTFDDGGSGLLFGTIALKGSNGTVDLTVNNAMIMFKR